MKKLMKLTCLALLGIATVTLWAQDDSSDNAASAANANERERCEAGKFPRKPALQSLQFRLTM